MLRETEEEFGFVLKLIRFTLFFSVLTLKICTVFIGVDSSKRLHLGLRNTNLFNSSVFSDSFLVTFRQV